MVYVPDVMWTTDKVYTLDAGTTPRSTASGADKLIPNLTYMGQPLYWWNTAGTSGCGGGRSRRSSRTGKRSRRSRR